MLDLNMEFVKDGLKILVIFLPLAYFLVKARGIIARKKGLFLLMAGFVIMLLGGIVDFADEFAALNNVFLVGLNFPHHETIEDILGVIGFTMFALGIALEIKHARKENIEKEKLIRRLSEQAEKLKKFDDLKSKFIRDVSHEFCSPLSCVNLSLSNIIDGLMGDVTGKQKSILQNGKKNLERLGRLVTDLLTLSKIESGKMIIQRKQNDVSLLAEEAYLSMKPMFERRRITFSRVSYLHDPKIWCDGDRIIQVFVNIFSNSLKYGLPGSEISVRLSEEGRHIRVEIEDKGKGMSQQELDKLFKEFERLDAEKEDGTGLGLVISKEILTLHHGRMWAESKLNEGTRFIFTIPRDARKENR